jgi:hypothetical protein
LGGTINALELVLSCKGTTICAANVVNTRGACKGWS